MKYKLWILVGDASRARLFRAKPGWQGLRELEVFEHANSRAHVRDLMTDANGRKPVGPVPASMVHGQGAAYGREAHTDPKEVEAQKFARELVGALERGLYAHAYVQLVIVAPPHFLGILRGMVSREVEKCLVATIGKDFTGVTALDLEERLAREHERVAQEGGRES